MRYLPLTDTDRGDMLARIGVNSIDDLFADIPRDKRLTEPPDLPRRQGEMQVERLLGRMAARNVSASSLPFFVGAGAYKHHVPASVDHLIQRSEFLTSYTPYQPEIAQGTLQYLFEFQTQVAELTGMEVANASMYDGSTATGEAVLMAHRVTQPARRRCCRAGCIRTMPKWSRRSPRMAGDEIAAPRSRSCARARTSSPASTRRPLASWCSRPTCSGNLRDLARHRRSLPRQGRAPDRRVHRGRVARPRSIRPAPWAPTSRSAKASRSAMASSTAGPMSACSTAKAKYLRQMPGRLCGETVDAEGRRGYVLTLSTREQHIRRDKATSNICTNSGLCVLAFTIHMTPARRGRPEAARAHQSRECGEARRRLVGREGRASAHRAILQRIHLAPVAAGGRRRRGAREEERARRRAGRTPFDEVRSRRSPDRRLDRGEHG